MPQIGIDQNEVGRRLVGDTTHFVLMAFFIRECHPYLTQLPRCLNSSISNCLLLRYVNHQGGCPILGLFETDDISVLFSAFLTHSS